MPASHQPDRFTEVRNPKALRDYFIEERFEAGIALRGSEVKSIRAGRAQMADCFGRFEKGELWLYNLHIDEYSHAGLYTHDPRRARKLLLHRHQIRKIAQALETGGRTLVALRLYFKQALVKVEVALATGKQQHDRRRDLQQRAVEREMARALHRRR